MKTVKNIGNKDMEVPFNFFTYSFPVGKSLAVSDDVSDFIEERWPLSFNFSKNVDKGVEEVKKVKTKAYIHPENNHRTDESMSIEDTAPKSSFGGADDTPADGTTDRDGVSWYGEGIEITGGKHVS